MRFSKRLRAALAGNALPEEETPLFTGGALKKLILPLIIEQTLTITVGMADTVMVSSLGDAAMSGVSLVDTLTRSSSTFLPRSPQAVRLSQRSFWARRRRRTRERRPGRSLSLRC